MSVGRAAAAAALSPAAVFLPSWLLSPLLLMLAAAARCVAAALSLAYLLALLRPLSPPAISLGGFLSLSVSAAFAAADPLLLRLSVAPQQQQQLLQQQQQSLLDYVSPAAVFLSLRSVVAATSPYVQLHRAVAA